jgi:hypothetical protein
MVWYTLKEIVSRNDFFSVNNQHANTELFKWYGTL